MNQNYPSTSIDNQQYSASTSMHQVSQVSYNLSQPQANVVMAEYSFFYKVYNDFQIYHITCKETSLETALSNHDHSTQSNILHVFYFQHPDDRKIYQVVC